MTKSNSTMVKKNAPAATASEQRRTRHLPGNQANSDMRGKTTARRNALSRLHENLLASRGNRGKTLTGELANLRASRSADSTGDSADAAFDAGSDEMSSRLAELDDRELSQIDRALARWQQGTYGICEGNSAKCQKSIPVARLQALPYTTMCINCEREMEKQPNGRDRWGRDNWNQVSDLQAPMQDQQINLSKWEMELSGNG
jgi:DnaK suppressor protein